MKKYRGDVGLVRDALAYSNVQVTGWNGKPALLADMAEIFNDPGAKVRRLKIYACKSLRDGTEEQKARFMERLTANFGERLQEVELHDGCTDWGIVRGIVIKVTK